MRRPAGQPVRGKGKSRAAEPVRWWSMRRAQNLKPATYRCPFCNEHLPALSEHVLIAPEDDRNRRRHAHTECVLRERRAGNLPSEEEWRRTQPRRPSLWQRLRARLLSD